MTEHFKLTTDIQNNMILPNLSLTLSLRHQFFKYERINLNLFDNNAQSPRVKITISETQGSVQK